MKELQSMNKKSGFIRSQRASSLQVSEIVRISEAAISLRDKGRDILTFGTGEPDFPTPEHVIEAAHVAAKTGQTKYPPTQGIGPLRKAIVADWERTTGVLAEPSQVIVSNGAKQVISNAFLATIDPGDEVIVPTPYWTSYSDIIATCEGVLGPLQTHAENQFRLQPEDLSKAITDKTRWLMLNSPGNPSGALYPRENLRRLADVLIEHPQVMILADEIYQHISYDEFASFRSVAPELADRTLIVNGVSKAYSMTGWRIGWGIGPTEMIAPMTAVQGQSTSGASSISQAAATAALSGPQELLASRLRDFRDRRDFVVEQINATSLLKCEPPGGAFYVFPDCSGVIGKRRPGGQKIGTDADFCDFLLNDFGVALVPGRAFGAPGHFRISYAYSMADLTEGCARIAKAVAALS